MRRRLRGRFGITAPRVAVRPHVPLHWRALGAVVVLACSLALSGWIYDAGRRFAGYERSASDSEIKTLREKNAELEAEAVRLRSIATTSESHLQIDRAAIDRITAQVKVLEEENIRLKENVAEFENLAKASGKAESVSLGRLRVEPDGAPGRYRYRLLAARRGKEAKGDFKGELRFQVTIEPLSGQSAIIALPRADDPAASSFLVSFRNLGSLEGSFQIPAQARLKRVEARLMQDGVVMATQSVSL